VLKSIGFSVLLPRVKFMYYLSVLCVARPV